MSHPTPARSILLGAACALSLVAQPPRRQDAELTQAVLSREDLSRGLDANHALRNLRLRSDQGGEIHTTAQQFYRGIPVFGGELIVKEGPQGLVPVTDRLSREIQIPVEPELTTSEALYRTHQVLAPKAPYREIPRAELVIYPITRLVPRPGIADPHNAEDFEEEVVRYELAYHVHAEIESEEETRHEDLLIQAQTGEVLKRWSTLHETTATGTGKSQHSGTVTLSTNSIPGGFALQDPLRSNLYTTNMANGTAGSGTLYQAPTNTWGDGANYVRAQGSTSPNGQTAAVDAHYGMQVTWDFLKNILGRNGIDGTGRTTFSRVHYSSSYDNAFWSDSCFCMTFGDGNTLKTLTALDVAAHEMAHGVCSTTARLVYSGESGGLNEANSDILATMVEFYARGAGAKGSLIPDTGGNWTMGEQLSTPTYPRPLRYMHKPSLDGRSPDAWSPTLGTMDVHFSSGPMNRAFYFLAKGASNVPSSETYSTYLPGGMAGLGNDRAMRIWWRTLSTKLTSTSNYVAARNGAIASAKELYGAGSPAEMAVWNAFAAINVGSPWTTPDTTAPSATAKVAGTSGTLSFTATATDNKGVTRVDYFVNGALKGSATLSPYTFAFNSAALPNGTHTLVAKAYDAANNVGTSPSVPFTVNNLADTTAPSVSAKVAGTSGTLSFTATATDNKGVTRVDYFVNGALKGSATASPYTFAFNSVALPNGTHTLVAKAYDAANNVGTSPSVPFTVNNLIPSTTMLETESNNTAATANVALEVTTVIKGALPSGSDLDTFKIPLVAGQTTQISLTMPSGVLYGLRIVQGFSPTFLQGHEVTSPEKRARHQTHLTFAASEQGAISGYATIQVYSVSGQASPSQYTLTIRR